MHRFRTSYTPIKGLSSDILVRLLSQPRAHAHFPDLLLPSLQIETAFVGYARSPDFSPYPAEQDRGTWDKVLRHLVEESMKEGYEARMRLETQKVQR
jgi:hypothetical protein